MSVRFPHRIWPSLAVLLWACIISAGLWKTWAYESTAAAPLAPANLWPATTSILRAFDEPTLVMAVHPNCPCTRASLTELADLVGRHPHQLKVFVLFVIPKGLKEDPATTDNWKLASNITDAQLIPDQEGAIARSFHATISGQVFLYDMHGDLRFRGGLTASRGHVGTSLGTDAIDTYLSTGTAPSTTSPVFGCSLF